MSPLSRARPVAVATATATVLAVVLAAPASAGPGGDPTANPTAPVVSITAPVIPIHTGTADLGGATTRQDTKDGAQVRLDSTILFAKDSAVLEPGAKTRIRRAARWLRNRGPGDVTVIGYTDDLGSAQHGLDLSYRRAAAVARILRDALPGRVIAYTGMGEANPVVPNTSEGNRRQNRRVIITMVKQHR